jgi:Galactose oxidase, central domain
VHVTQTGAFVPVSDDRILLYGGSVPGGSMGCGSTEQLSPTEDLYIFDVTNKTWSKLSLGGSQPPARVSFQGFYLEPYLYVVGGYEFNCPGAGQVYDAEGGYRLKILPRSSINASSSSSSSNTTSSSTATSTEANTQSSSKSAAYSIQFSQLLFITLAAIGILC